MKKGLGLIAAVTPIVNDDGMLSGVPNARGNLVIDKKGDVQYMPLEAGVHNIGFGERGHLAFDTAKVLTARVATSKLWATEAARKSVFGASIEVTERIVNQVSFPTGQQGFEARGKAYHFEPEGLIFESSATLTLPYESIEGKDDSWINIYYYDKELLMWEVIPKLSQNRENKTITVEISHFSDYVAGLSSFRIDEGGSINGGRQLGYSVDPYYGTLIIKSGEVSVQARGVNLELQAMFNSDYLYTKYLPTFTGSETTAGQSLVQTPNMKYPFLGVDISSGWSYELPSCQFSVNNMLTLILPDGKKYDLSQALIWWVGKSAGSSTTTTLASCQIEKPTVNSIRILIPEIGYGIEASVEDTSSYFIVRWNTLAKASNVRIYPADGKKIMFMADGSGNIQYLYDASGKNWLHYVYSGTKLQAVEHNDGRAIKIYSYMNSNNTKSLVYVLSSSTNMTTLNAEDQFLSRRVFDSSGRLQYADKLGTLSGFSASTSWEGVTASNESIYFMVLQRTGYSYTMHSAVAGNTLQVTEPGGGYKVYTFTVSFFPGGVSTKTAERIVGQGEESDTVIDYTYLYHNKPKVMNYKVARNINEIQSLAEVLRYNYASSCGRTSFSTNSYQTQEGSYPTLWNTMPAMTVREQSEFNGATISQVTEEVLTYSHTGSTTDTYRGLGEDVTYYYVSGTKTFHDKMTRTFTDVIYNAYYPSVESYYVGDSASAKWTVSYVYDSYGRKVKVTDSRAGRMYYRYLYGGQNTDSVFSDNPYTDPTDRLLYTSFGVVRGEAAEQSIGVYAKTYFQYDSLLNATTKRVYDTRSGAAVTLDTGYTYDGTTNVLTGITYPLGNVLALSYGTGWKGSYIIKDSRTMDNVTKLVNEFDYDFRGRRTSATPKLENGAGNAIVDASAPITTTRYVYDGLSRVTSKTRMVGGETTELYRRVYNDTNLTVTTTDAKGYRTFAIYDIFFRKIVEESFRPNTENQGVSYDGVGQVSVGKLSWNYNWVYRDRVITDWVRGSPTGPEYYRIENGYDYLGRLTKVSRGDQSGVLYQIKTFSYTDTANTVVEKNYRDMTNYTQTMTVKDWLDRVTSVTQYAGIGGTGTTSVTSMGYNYAGQVTSRTLANGETYTYGYSRSGLLESMVYPQGRGTETYTYDYNGRLTTKTDVGGNTTTYEYNLADLETQRKSTATATEKEWVWVVATYSQYGPKEVTKYSGLVGELHDEYSYAYNSGALTTTETRWIGGTGMSGMSSVSHGYDVAGNLRTLSVTGFDGSFSKTLNYSLPYFGGDGSSSDRSMKVSTGSTALGTISTNYAGTRNTTTYGSGLTTAYTNYDVFMRPWLIDNPGSEYDQSYVYDWQGNTTSWNGTSYAYDGMNRLTTGGYNYDIIGNQSAAPGSVSYSYVANSGQPTMRLDYKTVSGVTTDYTDDENLANLVSVAGKYTNLAYDPTNRLISLYDVIRGVTDSYRYGPEGLRYKETEGAMSGSSKTTYYLYEGNDILYEEGYEGSTKTFSKLNIYVGGVNIGRIRKVGSTESVQYFYNDLLGSRRAVTDSTGVVQAKIDYSVWGVPTVTNYNGYDGSLDVSYTGKERDAMGLYYFNARYYDPSIGRFITEDPARNDMNWFVYCGNNPLSFIDPSGLLNEHTLVMQENMRYRYDVAKKEAEDTTLKQQNDKIAYQEWEKDVTDKCKDAYDAFNKGDEATANSLLIHASNVTSWNNRQSTATGASFGDVVKSWWQKSNGAPLTPQEANIQKVVGVSEMGIGGAGMIVTVVPTHGIGIFGSLYVMADGGYLLSQGMNNIKANPGSMYIVLANPIVSAVNSFTFAVPFP